MALHVFCPLFFIFTTFKTEVVVLSAPCSYTYGRRIPQDTAVAILFSQKGFCASCFSSCHSPSDTPLFTPNIVLAQRSTNYSPKTSPAHLLFL